MSVLSQRFFSEPQLPPEPARLRRTLSLRYRWNGGESNIDPRGCTDAVERYERESAFLREHPNTPYAQGIREERANENAAAMRYRM
ncbi:MAG: hypothetical protein P4L65_08910 [Legionella sp.]|nr:hypothetical protein [Legionella sp.]